LAAEVAVAELVLELSLVQTEVQEVPGRVLSPELLVQELQVKAITEAVALVTVLMGQVMAVAVVVQVQQDKPLQEHRKEQVLQETVATELHG
jgi:hypothetical protein